MGYNEERVEYPIFCAMRENLPPRDLEIKFHYKSLFKLAPAGGFRTITTGEIAYRQFPLLLCL